MKIIAFRTPKPKQFSYKPLYYDEKKERLEELKKKYEDNTQHEGVSPDFKERLRSSWKVKERRTGNISKGTMVVYFVLVMVILYLIFFS
jgi:hypothetical protein